MHYHSVVQLQMLRHCFCLVNAHSTVRCGVYIFYCGVTVTVLPKLSATLYVSLACYYLHCWDLLHCADFRELHCWQTPARHLRQLISIHR